MRGVARFRDTGETLRSFADVVLVSCPSCGGCARVTASRGVCAACAWTQDSPATTTWGGPVDPWLRLPLWLATVVGDEVLWAFNAGHLDLLESYVSAGLRERPLERDHAMTTMAERLPPWVKSAKNRDAVLAGIARLRERVP